MLGSEGDATVGWSKTTPAIARALLVKALLLILDEATSALDNLSERAFQQALEALAKDRAVGHRAPVIHHSRC